MSQGPFDKFIDDLDAEQISDLIGIVVNQDPTELTGEGAKPRPRWNTEQRGVILAAQKAWEEAGLSD